MREAVISTFAEFSSPQFCCCCLFAFVLTLIWCAFRSRFTAVARKRPRSFCQKCRCWLHLNTHTPVTQRSRNGLTMPLSRHSAETYPERALTQLVSEHSSTVVSARWATVDRPWHKEWNWCARATLHFKLQTNKQTKQSAGGERMVKHSPKSSQARKKPPPRMGVHHALQLEIT